jgi:hypothetical protein
MMETRTKKFGLGVLVAIVAAIGVGLTDTIREEVKSLASRARTLGQAWIEEVFPPELPKAEKNAALSILVAQLEGDEDSSQTKHLRASLRCALDLGGKGQQIQVLDAGRTLKQGASSDVWRQREATEARGREWLKRSGAGLLIWGEVAGRDKVLRINFLLRRRNNQPAERKLCVIGTF